MQCEFAHQLFESSRTLGLLCNVFENGGIRKHESCQLPAYALQNSKKRLSKKEIREQPTANNE
jgi:hypothetical protein